MTNTKKNNVMSKGGSRKKSSLLSRLNTPRGRVGVAGGGLAALAGLTFGAHKTKTYYDRELLDLADTIEKFSNNPNNDKYLAQLIAVKESVLFNVLNKTTKTRIKNVITTKLDGKSIEKWKGAHPKEMVESLKMVVELLKADKEERESLLKADKEERESLSATRLQASIRRHQGRKTAKERKVTRESETRRKLAKELYDVKRDTYEYRKFNKELKKHWHRDHEHVPWIGRYRFESGWEKEVEFGLNPNLVRAEAEKYNSAIEKPYLPPHMHMTFHGSGRLTENK